VKTVKRLCYAAAAAAVGQLTAYACCVVAAMIAASIVSILQQLPGLSSWRSKARVGVWSLSRQRYALCVGLASLTAGSGTWGVNGCHPGQRMRVRIMEPMPLSLPDPCVLGPGNTFQKRSVSSPAPARGAKHGKGKERNGES
jgi:hypothetical protein